MNGYLLDTSVLSLLVPNRPDVTSEFLEWVAARDRELHVSAVSVAEIEQGIAKLRRQGGRRSPTALANWLEISLSIYKERIIPFDVAEARAAGHLADLAFSKGRPPSAPDVYIAATAAVHGLVVLTRNLKHFEPLDVEAVDPLVALPR